jgi:hypothetical protein
MLPHVVSKFTDVSNVLAASIIRAMNEDDCHHESFSDDGGSRNV